MQKQPWKGVTRPWARVGMLNSAVLSSTALFPALHLLTGLKNLVTIEKVSAIKKLREVPTRYGKMLRFQKVTMTLSGLDLSLPGHVPLQR